MLKSSLPDDWVHLPFDTSALGVRTALLKSTIEFSQLRKVINTCAKQGLELLYWTPDSDVGTVIHNQEWFTGYGVAKGVEFKLPLANRHSGSTSQIPLEMSPDFFVEPLASIEEEDFYDLVDLALIAGHHSRFRLDPALTHAQFKSLYKAWLQNSVTRQVADQIFVARRKEDGKATGFITVKLAVDRNSASIGLLGVSPSCQRQGLGAALISAACEFTQSADIPQITVRTQEDNHMAINFYGAQGFMPHDNGPKTTYHIWLTHRVIDRVQYNVPYLTGDEGKEVSRLINSQRLDSLGRYTVACEHWLETNLGCSKALLTLSATAALEQAILLCKIGPGDEVIMPSFTFVSTANAVALRMATPVFIDVGDDLNMDIAAVSEAVTSKTKAIMVVHYGGNACDMDNIMHLAKEKELYVIEDAAQAFLSKYKGRCLGTIGHLGCLSFHYTKNTVCGEGGALLVNDPRFHSPAAIIREKGTNRADFMLGSVSKYEWMSLGSSYVPSELCSAFLLPQLLDANESAYRRKRVCDAYRVLLAPLAARGCFRFLKVLSDRNGAAMLADTCGNGHLFPIIFPSTDSRKMAQTAMTTKNVQCLTHFVPLHLSQGGMKYGKVWPHASLESTITASACLLRLPVWPGMRFGHIQYVVQVLYEHFGEDCPSVTTAMHLFMPTT
ncbi:hypothetical protein VYU27_005303 [Nannochloropsis oceanica]